MKKFLSLVSICVLMVLLAGCGGDEQAKPANNSTEADAGVDAADDSGTDADIADATDAADTSDAGGDADAETLPEERCDHTGTCSDGERVCSDVRTDSSNDSEAFCQFPDTSAAGEVGDQCTGASECHSRLCLGGLSDECSVVCINDEQCAAGQVCTTYSVGNSQIGFCNRGCADNDDCTDLDFTDDSGDTVEHVCTLNENTRDDTIDQVCLTKNVVDPDDDTAGLLGDACPSGEGSECQSGQCLRTVTFDGTSCNSASDCEGEQVCEEASGSGEDECGDVAFLCSRVCDDNADCSTGVTDNELTECSADVSITFESGLNDTVSMCAKPDAG